MNEEILTLLLDVTERLERAIIARDCPAIVALQGRQTLVMSDYDYLRDDHTAEAFERRAADQARRIGARRWVFAVPQVWVVTDGMVCTRAVSNHPLRPGEAEAVIWMACDQSTGVDYGRLAYGRRPNGEPIFDEPEVLTVEVRPDIAMPGFRLLRAFLAEDDEAPSS